MKLKGYLPTIVIVLVSTCYGRARLNGAQLYPTSLGHRAGPAIFRCRKHSAASAYPSVRCMSMSKPIAAPSAMA